MVRKAEERLNLISRYLKEKKKKETQEGIGFWEDVGISPPPRTILPAKYN